MTEPLALGDAISSQIRRYRLAKEWSVRRLAEECQRLGAPGLTEASLGNIERGHRGGQRGTRRVLAEELIVLAQALDVAPILLVFPLDAAPTIEVSPGRVVSTWDALRWFTGEGPISPDNIDRFHGAGQYDPQSDKLGHGHRDPQTGMFEWYADATWEAGAWPAVLMRQLVDEVGEWLHRAPTAGQEERQRLLARIRATLAEMRRRGMPPPPLPEGIATINYPEEGGTRGRPDQAG